METERRPEADTGETKAWRIIKREKSVISEKNEKEREKENIPGYRNAAGKMMRVELTGNHSDVQTATSSAQSLFSWIVESRSQKQTKLENLTYKI